MNARVSEPAEGEAEVVRLPASGEASNQQNGESTANGQHGKAEPRPRKKGSKRRIAMIVVPLVLVVGGGYFYLTGGRYEDTDNAYVNQAIVSLSPDVAGRIVDVDVKENEPVKAGQVLFHIDPAPYKIALQQAEAQLAAARVNVNQLRVQYTTAKAKLAAAQLTLDVRTREQKRNTNLANKGVTTAAAVDTSLLNLQQAQADVTLDQQGVASAVAALGGNPDVKTDDFPAVQTAIAGVADAKRNLAKTTVTAPDAGVVSQVSELNVGQFVPVGTTIASLVETGKSWVEANFKETQLTHMTVGEPTTVEVDAFPGKVFHGTVGSIGAATGSQFALIPAQNATGNWVKVVQRVPVRIDLGTSDDNLRLRSGLSSNVSVDTGKTLLDRMLGH